MNRILVPTDFSDQAKYALDFAVQIARRNGASITLLNVVDYPGLSTVWMGGLNVIGGVEPPADSVDEQFINGLLDKAREDLKNTVDKINDTSIPIVTRVLVGNPYYCIIEEIEKEEVNLVVIGNKGMSGLEEILIGSIVEKVVRHAKCPVITIKRQRDLDAIKNIVFASGFEEEQDYVVSKLVALQKLTGARLHLVKINTPNNFQTTRHIKKEIEDFINKYHLENYSIHFYDDFLEEDGIIYFAEDLKADMIALGTHGRSGIMHLLSGSIAEGIVNHAQRPVWTCKIKI